MSCVLININIYITCSQTEIIFSTITFCEDGSTEQHWEIVITTVSTVRAYDMSVRTEGARCYLIVAIIFVTLRHSATVI